MISSAALIPDVGIRRTSLRAPRTAAATIMAPSVRMRTRLATKTPHVRIEIRDASHRQLVTAIELLSPTNKGSGRKEYLRKRRRFLHSSAHLMEIDLHHHGRRMPLNAPYPQAAYFVLFNNEIHF